MIEKAIEEFQNYLNKSNQDKKELFADEAKKISLQFCLHKIPNLKAEKNIMCKLPHSLNPEDNLPEVCLIVKDIDKSDRDYEKTIRKYQKIIEQNGLTSLIKQIIPMKQLNLEFRPYETKRKLSTSFDLFLADKSLHDILFGSSKLGKEFKKRRKMPFGVDLEGSKNLKQDVMDILNSTLIRLNGKGTLIDVNTFLSTNSTKEALENINEVKAQLIKNLPGGESNIKSIYIKSTDTPAVPIYLDPNGNINEIKLPNNMTPTKVKKAKKMSIKRLKKNAEIKKKQKLKETKQTSKKVVKIN